jgi:metal-responsive CopG/Arc/MetJ family transcriptional regulator
MAGANKRKILNISLPSELYREVEKLAKEQAKAKGEFVREVLRQYIETDRRWKQIREWGEESAKRYEIKGERGVEDIIEQYRKEQSV